MTYKTVNTIGELGKSLYIPPKYCPKASLDAIEVYIIVKLW